MIIRAVFFDLDGTLVDSLADLTDGVNHVRQMFFLPQLSQNNVRLMVGKGARNLIQQALPDTTESGIDRAVVLFLDYNREHIADKSHLYPGMRESLINLAERSIKLAVITNKNAELSSLLLHALGIHDLFDTISGGDTYSERKPSPIPLLKVAKNLGVTATQCVMVGDSINDIQAAQHAGIASIGCTWGFGGQDELVGATVLAHSPHELPAAIAAGLRQHSP